MAPVAPSAWPGGVEREEPGFAVAVRRGEARAKRRTDFSRMKHPAIRVRRRPVLGPRTSSSSGIGRARIRLVNQLESGTSSMVLTLPRADAGRVAARRGEQIEGEVVEEADVGGAGARRVLAFGLARQRIVGEEARRRAAGAERDETRTARAATESTVGKCAWQSLLRTAPWTKRPARGPRCRSRTRCAAASRRGRAAGSRRRSRS